jgi:hypothetical protein
MPLRQMLPTVLLAAVLSIVVGVLAAARGASVPLGLAVGLFAAQVLLTLWRINAPAWRAGRPQTPAADWALSNTVLTAIAYAWGAAALFCIYGLSDLHWRHWWQYGAGMALLAGVALLCARYLASERGLRGRASTLNIIMAMTVAQAMSVAAALIYLVASGALDTQKGDWAANHVFVAGGLMIGTISLVSLLVYRRTPITAPAGT